MFFRPKASTNLDTCSENLTRSRYGIRTTRWPLKRPHLHVRSSRDSSAVEKDRAANLVTVDSLVPLDSFLQSGFRSRPVGGVIVLDLSVGPDALFRQFHIKRRSNIRAALRRGVQVLTPTSETQIAEFYEVYDAWRCTKRKRVHGDKLPLEVFKERFRLKDNFQFILASFSGRIIAGIVLRFAPKGLVECASNSSLDEFLHLRPNDLLVWNAIQWACNQGFSRMSLGAGHRFLREFGGISIPVYRYRRDQTRFRRYDMAAGVTDRAKQIFQQLPLRLQHATRKLLGKPSAHSY